MTKWNTYYRIAFTGAAANLLIQLTIAVVADPYLAAVFTPFYSVWIIVFIVGWRKKRLRR